MGKHTPHAVSRRQAMSRHPAGKGPTSHSGATVYPFRQLQSSSTATAETMTKEGNENG